MIVFQGLELFFVFNIIIYEVDALISGKFHRAMIELVFTRSLFVPFIQVSDSITQDLHTMHRNLSQM